MTTQLPQHLTRSGVIAWNKLNEYQQKECPERFLSPYHFTSYEHHAEFEKERRLAPFRERLLDGVDSTTVDPVLIKNLIDMLADFSEKIEELESSKQDKPYDW